MYTERTIKKRLFIFKHFTSWESTAINGGGFFGSEKRGNMKKETDWKNIYCPICGRKVMKHDGWGTIPIYAKCNECYKVVCYEPNTNQVTVKKIPPRNTSNSGRIYWS